MHPDNITSDQMITQSYWATAKIPYRPRREVPWSGIYTLGHTHTVDWYCHVILPRTDNDSAMLLTPEVSTIRFSPTIFPSPAKHSDDIVFRVTSLTPRPLSSPQRTFAS